MFKTLFVAFIAIPALTVVSIENATAGTRQEMTGKASYGGSEKLTLPLSFTSTPHHSIPFVDKSEVGQSTFEIASLSDPSHEIRVYVKTPEVKYGKAIDNNALFFMQTDKMTTSSITKTTPKADE